MAYEAGGEAERKNNKTLVLEKIASEGMDLAQILPEEQLGRIAAQCLEAYERDKGERSEWLADHQAALDLVSGRRGVKEFPWPNASNAIYPLIATAALQFGARAYPAIVKGRDVVKPKITGDDPEGVKRERGDRIAAHMNWQLLEDMPEWELDTDKLVHMLPVHGCMFRQVVWDRTYTRPKTSLLSASRLVVTQSCRDLETVPIFCVEFELYPHEIEERMRDGRYREVDIQFSGEHKQAQQDLLECHCRYDLDEDGYDEPWIVIVHKEAQQVLSLKAGFWPRGVERGADRRVRKVRRHVEFIKYGFIPDLEGKFLDVGFGKLLREHSLIINTILNQLMDAATDQNAGGGFIAQGAKLRGGVMEWAPGEWKLINATGGALKDSIVPRPTSQPSPVLFNLLGLMIESGKELASIRDAITGETKPNQPATTTLAIIEQGLQVFSSIYKRIYRSLGEELKLIFKLNGAYLPPQAYFMVLDSQKAVSQQDYASGDADVSPVADPSATTSAQRLAKAEFLGGFVGNPAVDQREIMRRMMEAAEIENVDALLPEPDPQAMAMQAEAMTAEVDVKKGDAAKKAAETAKTKLEAEEIRQRLLNPSQPEIEPGPDPLDQESKQLSNEKTRIEIDERRTAATKSQMELESVKQAKANIDQIGQAVMGLTSHVERLAEQQAMFGQMTSNLTQGVQKLSEQIMAPVELERDPVTNKATRARRVVRPQGL